MMNYDDDDGDFNKDYYSTIMKRIALMILKVTKLSIKKRKSMRRRGSLAPTVAPNMARSTYIFFDLNFRGPTGFNFLQNQKTQPTIALRQEGFSVLCST